MLRCGRAQTDRAASGRRKRAGVEPANGLGAGQDIVVVTGPAGAGRSTAIRALEDFGFEAIDNLPLSLMPRLIAGPPMTQPLVVGRRSAQPRLRGRRADRPARRDRRAARLPAGAGLHRLRARRPDRALQRDAPAPPLEPARVADASGSSARLALLAPLRARADVLIDTIGADAARAARRARPLVRAAGRRRRAGGDAAVLLLRPRPAARRRHGHRLPVPAQSALERRAARARRPRPGRGRLCRGGPGLRRRSTTGWRTCSRFLLPAYRAEGKSYFSLALGCTGGKHRSVAIVESLAKTLADGGWQVSIRHRDLERMGAASVFTQRASGV